MLMIAGLTVNELDAEIERWEESPAKDTTIDRIAGGWFMVTPAVAIPFASVAPATAWLPNWK
jgi:hypothetical protein